MKEARRDILGIYCVDRRRKNDCMLLVIKTFSLKLIESWFLSSTEAGKWAFFIVLIVCSLNECVLWEGVIHRQQIFCTDRLTNWRLTVHLAIVTDDREIGSVL